MEFMILALEEARKAITENEVPVGCVIVHNGKVIAKGFNQTNRSSNVTK
jgi:tRNA-specific adenosine deaminase 2